MKVEFVQMCMQNIETGKLDPMHPTGQINLETQTIQLNFALSPYGKIRTLIHELGHYANRKLFSRMYNELERNFPETIDDFLDYPRERGFIVVDMLERWIGHFRNRSHAIEYALLQLMEKKE